MKDDGFGKWAGLRCLGDQGVVYNHPEKGPDVRNRFIAAARMQGLDRVPECIAIRIKPLDIFGEATHTENILGDWDRHPGDVETFIKELKDDYGGVIPFVPNVIIHDTLSRLLSGADENSSAVMGKAAKVFDHIAEKTGAKGIVIHHAAAGNFRGAKQLLDGAATVIKVERVGKAAPAPLKRMRVTVMHQRSGAKPPAPIEFNVVPIELGQDAEGKPITSVYLEQAHDSASRSGVSIPKQTTSLTQAYGVLKDEFPQGGSKRGWKTRTVEAGMAESTFDRAFKKLTESGRVTFKADVGRYFTM